MRKNKHSLQKRLQQEIIQSTKILETNFPVSLLLSSINFNSTMDK